MYASAFSPLCTLWIMFNIESIIGLPGPSPDAIAANLHLLFRGWKLLEVAVG